jgi:hypothetical protein
VVGQVLIGIGCTRFFGLQCLYCGLHGISSAQRSLRPRVDAGSKRHATGRNAAGLAGFSNLVAVCAGWAGLAVVARFADMASGA